MLRPFRTIRFYIAFILLLFVGFLWAGLNGVRLIGNDEERTENVNGQGGSHRSGGRTSRFYHK
ncbi:hypothetical protein [Tellurirhabdus rosea]|uniref:hypothetical protein n=1 Tax=Tellurirhabdus rosea TaxID=2674997 RepID=UPI00225BCCEC|nr:hypothetical protein [Tellurirhabdus rosea]